MRAHSLLLAAAAAAAALLGPAACDDPPATPPEPVEGIVEMGFYDDFTFTRLEPGDPLWVVNGIQGGTWTMPAIRVSGLLSFVDVECSMVTEGGERVSYVASKAKLFLAPDGWLESRMFPIPVFHPDEEGAPIDDLYGLGATLSCTVEDGKGGAGDCSLAVVIENGD